MRIIGIAAARKRQPGFAHLLGHADLKMATRYVQDVSKKLLTTKSLKG
jgi:hypothetical protein